ncbi:phasin family protein [Streptosporangium sp. NPDC000396]|uniref:phasin family protein n=1 Tax=Streptosporangium sp. NPDC000396 TaxID=3366185 RepID=UPI0036AD4C23
MVFEALRGYVQGATGLTELTTSKAREVVRDLLASGETGLSQMSGQVDRLAKELVTTGKANRSQLDEIIKTEVNRLLGAFDIALTEETEEIDRLRARVAELEAKLAAVEKESGKTPATRSRTAKASSGKPAASRAAAKAPSGKPAAPSRAAAKAGAEEKPAKSVPARKKAPAGDTGKEAKATSAAASDTVKASTGKTARAPRARATTKTTRTTKTTKSTSGGGA